MDESRFRETLDRETPPNTSMATKQALGSTARRLADALRNAMHELTPVTPRTRPVSPRFQTGLSVVDHGDEASPKEVEEIRSYGGLHRASTDEAKANGGGEVGNQR